MANPDEPYNATDVPTRKLPSRRLSFIVKNKQNFIMVYHHGAHDNIMYFHRVEDKVFDFWVGQSDKPIAGIEDLDDWLSNHRSELHGSGVEY